MSNKNVSYDPEKVTENISNRVKTTSSSNALRISNTAQNTSSTYNFYPLVLKQKLKGKGVICKDAAENSMEPRGVKIGWEHEAATKFDSDTQVRSNVDDDDKPMRKFVMSGAESCDGGISLREWLNSSSCRINKYGRLDIFKQILEFIDTTHSQGVVLLDLQPSCFTLLSSNKVKYIGLLGQGEDVLAGNLNKKRPLEELNCSCLSLEAKQRKLGKEIKSLRGLRHFTCIHDCRTKSENQIDSYIVGPRRDSRITKSVKQNSFSHQHTHDDELKFMSVAVQLEEKWYSSPEELNDGGCTFSSNIYSLGVLFFEVWKYILCKM